VTVRGVRLERSWSAVPTAALLGDLGASVPGAVRAGGWEVRGRLAPRRFDAPPADLRDVAGYLDPAEVLADPRLDLAVVDARDRELADLLPRLRRAGLMLLLPSPDPLDAEVLARLRAAGPLPELATGLLARWTPWACAVAACLPLAGGPVVQAVVRGWPPGSGAAAELVDLVAGWCGGVVAATADPGALPARALPDGTPVDWALLTETGAAVLVCHRGGPQQVRLSFAGARLLAGPVRVAWEGGEVVPLPGPPGSVPPVPRDVPVGLVAAAAALSEAVGGRALRAPSGEVPGAPGTSGGRWWSPGRGRVEPTVAGVGDLLVAAGALAALAASQRRGGWVETS
jgi:hypothetical protein